MRVIVNNNNLPNRVSLTNANRIGRVTFNKVAQTTSFSLGNLSDVVTAGQQDGDVLVYNSNTNTYIVRTLPRIDCGLF
jgi:hypothetical protein